MSILVTGGAGFIGSHTCVELLNAGYEVVVVDNLYNASEKALERVEQITGKKVTFYEADILDRDALNAIFDKEQVESVIQIRQIIRGHIYDILQIIRCLYQHQIPQIPGKVRDELYQFSALHDNLFQQFNAS